jgi:hypothetical protein
VSNKVTVGTSEEIAINILGEPDFKHNSTGGQRITSLEYGNPNARGIDSETGIQSISVVIKDHKVLKCSVHPVIRSQIMASESIKPSKDLNAVGTNVNRIFLYALFTNNIIDGKPFSNASVQGWISYTPNLTLTNIVSLNTAHIVKRFGNTPVRKVKALTISFNQSNVPALEQFGQMYYGHESIIICNNEFITKTRILGFGETVTLEFSPEDPIFEKALNAFSSLLKQ